MGGGGSQDRAADEMARQQQRIAQQLFTESQPLRTGLIQRSQDYLTNGIDNSATFSAYKAAAEPQYAGARDQIIADTPTGGALTAALAGLQTGRARDLTQARGSIDQSELARAMVLGNGNVNPAVAAQGNAAGIQAQRAEADAQRDAAKYAAIGEAAGAMLGGGK